MIYPTQREKLCICLFTFAFDVLRDVTSNDKRIILMAYSYLEEERHDYTTWRSCMYYTPSIVLFDVNRESMIVCRRPIIIINKRMQGASEIFRSERY